jgi:hypothetical protein
MLNRTLEKNLSPISNFIVALESPMWTMTQNVFGLGRGPPRWAQRAVKKPRFFKKCLYSLLLRKNMKIGIYRLPPIFELCQCSVRHNFLYGM